jgi:predicted metal-dependent phosphoesterase TrpH
MFSLRPKRDPSVLNADLHCHSSVSDGTLSPTEIALRAKEKGVQLWALTDHDELSGLAIAAEAARGADLPFVPGVEISVTWGPETLHIVGLRIDPESQVLADGLEHTRSGRMRRARDMSEQLDQVGIHGSLEGALAYAGNPDLIGRTHFARYIVEVGRCDDVKEVFTKYLIAGKPGYVPVQWATLDDALSWIAAAGGVAVIAHPGRYRLDERELHDLFVQFKERGGVGIEVVTGSHSPDQYKRFAKLAKEYGFRASRGSDFHGPLESRCELGSLPNLPDTVVPIWHGWA